MLEQKTEKKIGQKKTCFRVGIRQWYYGKKCVKFPMEKYGTFPIWKTSQFFSSYGNLYRKNCKISYAASILHTIQRFFFSLQTWRMSLELSKSTDLSCFQQHYYSLSPFCFLRVGWTNNFWFLFWRKLIK